ncbi:MAG: phosphoadenosine phosphosulfate reductase family protein [Rhizobiaceae bacterium]
MFMENDLTVRVQNPAVLNITARINAALDIIDLGIRRASTPILTTKFGPQSAVLLHLVSQVRPDIPVVWVDTGFNTDATLEFANLMADRLHLDLRVYRSHKTWNETIPASSDPQRGQFSEQVKLEPFRRALSELNPDVWITALRRDQTEFRDGLSLFQPAKDKILKVYPLLDWRDPEIEAYLTLHQLPSEQDYYDPTKAEPHLECGLHNQL